MYLFQFRLTIYHRSKKSNLMSDVLNRFFSIADKNNTINNLNIKSFHAEIEDSKIDNSYVFSHTLIAMNADFSHKLKIEYHKNKH